MRKMLAVAALAMVAGCTSQEVTGPVEEAPEVANMLPQPDDGEPEPEPTPTGYFKSFVVMDDKCRATYSCRKAAREAGNQWAAYFKARGTTAPSSGASVMMEAVPDAPQAMKAGYQMVCEIPQNNIYQYTPQSLRCTIKFYGAILMTLLLPWECATGAGCVAGAAAAGYAWDDYFTTDTRTESHRYLRDWTKDPFEGY